MKKLLYIFLMLIGVTTANAQYKGDGYDGFNAGSTNFFLPVYVKSDAVGANNGMNWTDAYTTLTNALTNSVSQEIWVAAGTYTGGATSPCPMYLGNNSLYGGFAGTETLRSQRSWTVNLTYIEGLLSTQLQTSIFYKIDASQAVVDGFIIRNAKDQTTATGGGVFNITAGNVWIENVVAYNNYSVGSGGFLYSSVATVTNYIIGCNISSNWSFGNGGAIHEATAAANLFIYNSTFATNVCATNGGAINSQGLLIMTNNVFVLNSTTNGNGGAVRHSRANSTNYFENCLFASNSVASGTLDGGALQFGSLSTNTFVNCSFITNYVAGNGRGGVMQENASGGKIYFYSCGFTNNWATGAGGALNLQDGNVMLKDCSFAGNASIASDGGAIRHQRSNAIHAFTNCVFSNNTTVSTSGGNGGAICYINAGGIYTFTDCTFFTNSTKSATGSGGAIYYGNAGVATYQSCGFTNNWSGNLGGAIYTKDNNLLMTNCSFVGNSTTNAAAGTIYCATAGATNTFANCYFASNFTTKTAGHGGVLHFASASTNIIQSCAFVTNYALGSDSQGGCIFEAAAGGSLQIYDCGFTNNWSGSAGGVVSSQSSSLQITNSSFVGNNSTNNASGAIYHIRAGATNNFNNCYFSNNFTTIIIGHGGAIYFASLSTNIFNSCSFVTNYAGGNSALGSCIYEATAGGLLQVYNCGFTNNWSGSAGGVVSSQSSSLQITNSSFVGNNSTNNAGGVIYHTKAGATNFFNNCYFASNFTTKASANGGVFYFATTSTNIFDSCSFVTNYVASANASGGVIYELNVGGLLKIYNSGFTNNWSGGFGGTIYSLDNALQITNCSFVGNSSTNNAGGAIYHTKTGATNNYLNCSFVANSAKTTGGAINYSSVTGSFINCTFFTNNAGTAGGAIFCAAASVFGMSNNIFWKQVATTTGTNIDNNGGTIYAAYSDISTNSGMIRGTQINGVGIFFSDPLFASETIPYDVHVKSTIGRYDSNLAMWVYDNEYSPTIDAGSPFSPYSLEPLPNGSRINLGYYGNTAEASKSIFGAGNSVPNIFNDIFLKNNVVIEF